MFNISSTISSSSDLVGDTRCSIRGRNLVSIISLNVLFPTWSSLHFFFLEMITSWMLGSKGIKTSWVKTVGAMVAKVKGSVIKSVACTCTSGGKCGVVPLFWVAINKPSCRLCALRYKRHGSEIKTSNLRATWEKLAVCLPLGFQPLKLTSISISGVYLSINSNFPSNWDQPLFEFAQVASARCCACVTVCNHAIQCHLESTLRRRGT